MVRSPRGPGRALIIKRFFTLDAIDAGRPMPAPGSTAYFEHAIEHILREIAKVEVRARYQSRLLRPWRAWQLRKLRHRLTHAGGAPEQPRHPADAAGAQ